MSVVTVIESPRRVVMLTDTSLYDGAGNMLGFDRKAIPVDAWNGAISFRGNTWGLAAGLELAERFGSFDEFVARSGQSIEREYRGAVARGELSGQFMVEITAVGWSERDDRAKAFVLTGAHCVPEEFEHPEFVWVPVREIMSEGILHVQLNARSRWRLHRQGAEPGVDYTADTFDPVRHGLPLIEEQRRTRSDPRTGYGGLYMIGGELWLTVVDREGTRQDVIHEWPDKPGEPIKVRPIDESRLPQIVPTTFEEWTFAQVEEDLRSGAIHPETLQYDPSVAFAKSRGWEVPEKGLSRDARRRAKALARRTARVA